MADISKYLQALLVMLRQHQEAPPMKATTEGLHLHLHVNDQKPLPADETGTQYVKTDWRPTPG